MERGNRKVGDNSNSLAPERWSYQGRTRPRKGTTARSFLQQIGDLRWLFAGEDPWIWRRNRLGGSEGTPTGSARLLGRSNTGR